MISWAINNPVKRRNSREVSVGNIGIGGCNPIRIQSMTNTDTMDTDATVQQCMRLVDSGCELVRITASNVQAAENLYNIKNELAKRNYNVPLIADIHFNPKAAEVAAAIVDKVRINPGNYTDRNTSKSEYSQQEYDDELSKIADRLFPLIEICKANHTAMRIGTNHGSLSRRIMSRYGDTPYAMAVSAMEFARMLAAMLQEEGLDYPIHLGVTEAGNGQDGRIKSMAGIGSLLAIGIGDTIRVSLTEKPENEIPVANRIVHAYKDIPFESKGEKIKLAASFERHTGANDRNKILNIDSANINLASVLATAQKKNALIRIEQTDCKQDCARLAGDVSALIMEGVLSGVSLSDKTFEADLLQATGEKIYKAEFIACPSCGRTKYDIQAALEKVKQRCKHLKGLKIAVMGCIVNGPGEMADANYGYIGSLEHKVHLYRDGKLVHSNVEEDKAIELLVAMIKEDGKWQEEKQA